MPEQSTNFRSALYGFNKEDVVQFIDKMTKTHLAELQSLRAEKDQIRRKLDEVGSQLETVKTNAEAEAETKRLLEQKQVENFELQEANAKLIDQIKALEQEMEKLRAEAAQEEPPEPALSEPIPQLSEVMAYQAPAKDYTELELAAYRRAELAERLARERANDVYRQVQSVFSQANSKFETGKTDLEEMTKALQSDVKQLMSLLANISSAYNDAELSFEQISERNRGLIDEEE